MEIAELGSRIARYRRAAGMTQEALGRCVGVSTQAVSRWECGGAPDVALLPAIADALRVTVDALFGREGGTAEDMEQTISRGISAMAGRGEWERMIRLLLPAIAKGCLSGGMIPHAEMAKSCLATIGGETHIIPSCVLTDDLYLHGSFAEDLHFLSIYPEPKDGFAAFFDDNDAYRALFSALAQPNVLEVLLALLAEHPKGFSATAVAKRAGLAPEAAEAALETLSGVGVLCCAAVEMEDGEVRTWTMEQMKPLVPLLYAARYLCLRTSFGYYMIELRKDPLLRKDRQDEKEGT